MMNTLSKLAPTMHFVLCCDKLPGHARTRITGVYFSKTTAKEICDAMNFVGSPAETENRAEFYKVQSMKIDLSRWCKKRSV